MKIDMDSEARASLRHFISAALIFGSGPNDKRAPHARALEAFDEWFALVVASADEPRETPTVNAAFEMARRVRENPTAYGVGVLNDAPSEVFWLYELTRGEGVYQGIRGPDAERIIKQIASEFPEAGEPFSVPARGVPVCAAPRYTVEPNHCSCHPQTCCCNPWLIVVGGETHSTYYDRATADQVAAALNAAGVSLLNGERDAG